MKRTLATAAILAFGLVVTPAFAETADTGVTKAPTKTLGDEGKLPPTTTTDKAVPDMTGPVPAENPIGEDGRKRMGDEGKLPATATGSKSVPDMTAPAK